MEIGDRVVRKTTERKGYIHDVRTGRIVMVKVRWLDGCTDGEWVPSEEVRIWDKLKQPTPLSQPAPLKPLPSLKRQVRVRKCKKCGKGNLHWEISQRGQWQLFDRNKIHKCKL